DRQITRDAQSPGEAVVDYFIAWQARFLARQIKKDPARYKPARHVSMDLADPHAIALSSIANMPKTAQDRELYTHAVASLYDPRQHITGNIFEELPFEDGSLTLITGFDGYPSYFQKDETIHGSGMDWGEIALNIMEGWYRKLAYGGKMVISPWTTYRSNYPHFKSDKKILDAVKTEFSTRTGQPVHVVRISKKALEGWMSDSDRDLASSISPMFSREDFIDTVIINKPNKNSHKSAVKAAAQRSAGSLAVTGESQG
ncbi:MAG TPA: hypothetical protein VHB72_01610, partial [Candidatus Saccharimonadales bacterium]|nr:hypothetical protein [Candidatus Saccharimonadales bacterium]